MYPTNVQGEVKNFNKIILFNFLASITLMIFYLTNFKYLNLLLFPNINLNINTVILISFSCLFYSLSNLLSYKLNISGIYRHSIAKILLTTILIPLLFKSSNINELIQFLIIFAILFVIVDMFCFLNLKNFQNSDI